MIRPQPKPVRAEKPKRWGTRRQKKAAPKTAGFAFPKPVKPEKTKHSRRPREWGFMMCSRSFGCELDKDKDLQRILGIKHVCEGPIEFAHLSDLKRYDIGDIGAGLCKIGAHMAVDGKVGGKAFWYVKMDYTGQHMVRMRLANRARAAWDALTPEQREEWERRAAARRMAS